MLGTSSAVNFRDLVAGFANVIQGSGVELRAGGETVSAHEMLSDLGWLPVILERVYWELRMLVGESLADGAFRFEANDEGSLFPKRVLIADDAPAVSRVVVSNVLGHVLRGLLGVGRESLEEAGSLTGRVVDLNDVNWGEYAPSFTSQKLHDAAREQ